MGAPHAHSTSCLQQARRLPPDGCALCFPSQGCPRAVPWSVCVRAVPAAQPGTQITTPNPPPLPHLLHLQVACSAPRAAAVCGAQPAHGLGLPPCSSICLCTGASASGLRHLAHHVGCRCSEAGSYPPAPRAWASRGTLPFCHLPGPVLCTLGRAGAVQRAREAAAEVRRGERGCALEAAGRLAAAGAEQQRGRDQQGWNSISLDYSDCTMCSGSAAAQPLPGAGSKCRAGSPHSTAACWLGWWLGCWHGWDRALTLSYFQQQQQVWVVVPDVAAGMLAAAA
jgi:hypothetical protein